MKQQTIDRLSVLRSAMTANGVDAVIINKTDPHQNEYISEHWALLKYISGFTGSNATLVVTASKALLWTDSRYFLQAAIELEGTTIELMKEDLPGTPSVADWLCDNWDKLPKNTSQYDFCRAIVGLLFQYEKEK